LAKAINDHPARRAAACGGPRGRRLAEPVLGVLLLLPALLLLALLTLYPVLYGVWISFFNKHSFFPQQTFVGLSNYAAIVSDPEFWVSVRRGAVYSLTTIMLQVALGMGAALLLMSAFPAETFCVRSCSSLMWYPRLSL
jgi:ABC-type sugar transport system permease subunit